jgi:hypothetical protein
MTAGAAAENTLSAIATLPVDQPSSSAMIF